MLTFRWLTGDKRITVEFTAENTKTAVEILSELQELFDQDTACGCCKSTNVYWCVREAQGFTFYERRCRDCRAQLGYGQAREGGRLFPKRKDESGNWSDTGGWFVYQREQNREF